MNIISPNFPPNGQIPSKYTCDGDNINPELSIEGVPNEAKSLVLIMDDPDAVKVTGKVWDHWIVFNIPSNTMIISEGQEPPGIHGKGTGENLKYSGPCPPDGEHSYVFRLYALDREINLPEGITREQLDEAVQRYIIDQTELIGKYKKKQF